MRKGMERVSLLQIRVDTALKNQVEDTLNDIGLDIPTAVRMFLKAVIRDQKLPFTGTNISFTIESEYDADQLVQLITESLKQRPPSKRKSDSETDSVQLDKTTSLVEDSKQASEPEEAP